VPAGHVNRSGHVRHCSTEERLAAPPYVPCGHGLSDGPTVPVGQYAPRLQPVTGVTVPGVGHACDAVQGRHAAGDDWFHSDW
jgi:hypothetical protein